MKISRFFLKRSFSKVNYPESISTGLGAGGTICFAIGSAASSATVLSVASIASGGLIAGIALIAGSVVFKWISIQKKNDKEKIIEYINYRSERIELRQHIIIILLSILLLGQFKGLIICILTKITSILFSAIFLISVIILLIVFVALTDKNNSIIDEVNEAQKKVEEEHLKKIKKSLRDQTIRSRHSRFREKQTYFRSRFR